MHQSAGYGGVPRATHIPAYASESLSVPPAQRHAQELAPAETLLLHWRCLLRGLKDAGQIEPILDGIATAKETQARITKNSALQVVLLVSALLFDHLILPSTHRDSSSLFRVAFQLLWLWPITILSFLLSGVGNVATASSLSPASYHARTLSTFVARSARSPSSVDYRGLTATLLAESYRLAILANYLGAVTLLRKLPWLGLPLAFTYSSIVNSYYLFESRWIDQGLSLPDRVKGLEQRYSYHAGFGCFITLVTFWHPSLFVNLSLFALLFPLLLLNAASASTSPLPFSPLFPLSASAPPGSHAAPPSHPIASERAQLRASSVVPARLPILAPAAWLHTLLVEALSPSSGAGRSAARIRASRKKDLEMEDMEGGGDAWSSTAEPTGYAGMGARGDERICHPSYEGLNGAAVGMVGLGSGVKAVGAIPPPPQVDQAFRKRKGE